MAGQGTNVTEKKAEKLLFQWTLSHTEVNGNLITFTPGEQTDLLVIPP